MFDCCRKARGYSWKSNYICTNHRKDLKTLLNDIELELEKPIVLKEEIPEYVTFKYDYMKAIRDEKGQKFQSIFADFMLLMNLNAGTLANRLDVSVANVIKWQQGSWYESYFIPHPYEVRKIYEYFIKSIKEKLQIDL